MKIDTDLRLAIKSAEKAQTSLSWEEREALQRAAIDRLLEKKPSIGKAITKLRDTIIECDRAESKARQTLCQKYGLKVSSNNGNPALAFADCGRGGSTFRAIGGEVPRDNARWRYDDVMTELAAADPGKLATILKKYGIVWE